MYYVTSRKAWKDSLLQGSSFLELLNPKSEDSQSLKPLSSLKRRQSYLSFENHQLHPASWQAQKHTLPIYKSSDIYFLCWSSLWFCLVFCIALQPPGLLWSPFIAVCDVTRMKQSDWSHILNVAPLYKNPNHSQKHLSQWSTLIFFQFMHVVLLYFHDLDLWKSLCTNNLMQFN